MTLARTFALLAAALSVMIAAPSWAQSREERRRLNELDGACYNAREEKIRQVQEQRIEECVKLPPAPRAAQKTRGDCERHWAGYGWRQGVGTDLPECKEAFEARQQFRAPTRPSRQVP